ncbi:hypothetical protein J6590_075279 [Homalodisca vitripennis]|nr:hypothetical protein J6590_075279 [Homalodisca vitripennis]
MVSSLYNRAACITLTRDKLCESWSDDVLPLSIHDTSNEGNHQFLIKPLQNKSRSHKTSSAQLDRLSQTERESLQGSLGYGHHSSMP